MTDSQKQITARLMKSQLKSYADQARVLRKFEKHCRRMAIQKRMANKPNTWNTTREQNYLVRMAIREVSRYEGLARQFLRGVPYKEVENSTREYNEPKVWRIVSALDAWGVVVKEDVVAKWVSQIA